VAESREELEQAEKALGDARARLALALRSARVGTWIYDLKTDRVFADEQLAELFGVTPTDANGGKLIRFLKRVHPDDRARVLIALQHAICKHLDFQGEYRIVGNDGAVRWILASGQVEYSASGEPARLPGAAVDITERKQSERAVQFLARAGALLTGSRDVQDTIHQVANLAVDTVADCCLVDRIGEDGRVERFVTAHRDPAEERALVENPRFPHPADLPNRRLSQRVLTKRTVFVPEMNDGWMHAIGAESAQYAHLGHRHIASLIIVPVSAGKKVLGRLILYLVNHDPHRFNDTDRELAEELGRRLGAALQGALLQEKLSRSASELREANRQKDEFLAMLAHELRNPLAPISNAIEVLKRTDEPKVAARARDIVTRQLQQLVRLVDDLLDLSRVSRGKISLRRARIDLDTALTQAIEATAQDFAAHAHKLVVEPPAAPIYIDADLARLTQVFSNLLGNATKFTPRGGHIRLAVAAENKAAVIRVRDDGLGIAPAKLKSIFGLFTQGGMALEQTRNGLGIGLTLVRRLVKMHGGSVEAKSAGINCGSEFIVHLPMAAAAPAEQLAVATAPIEHRRHRILVIDDNKDVANSLSMMLEAMGHTSRICYDSKEALGMAAAFQPDTAFLDIAMPGLDSYELARRIRAQAWGADLTLVAVTGWGQEDVRQRTRAAGFDAHFVKPIAPEAVEKLLASQ
jgi:PAS domain S-box-containing protein